MALQPIQRAVPPVVQDVDLSENEFGVWLPRQTLNFEERPEPSMWNVFKNHIMYSGAVSTALLLLARCSKGRLLALAPIPVAQLAIGLWNHCKLRTRWTGQRAVYNTVPADIDPNSLTAAQNQLPNPLLEQYAPVPLTFHQDTRPYHHLGMQRVVKETIVETRQQRIIRLPSLRISRWNISLRWMDVVIHERWVLIGLAKLEELMRLYEGGDNLTVEFLGGMCRAWPGFVADCRFPHDYSTAELALARINQQKLDQQNFMGRPTNTAVAEPDMIEYINWVIRCLAILIVFRLCSSDKGRSGIDMLRKLLRIATLRPDHWECIL